MNKVLSQIENEIVHEIDANHLMEYNRMIAREVRLSGSEEELRAFEYVKSKLESFGLSPSLIFHDAYISLPLEASLVVGERDITCITHSMAASTNRDGLRGELVYLGDLSIENKEQACGKIVVLEGIALPEILIHVEQAGAIGVIFISGPYTHEMIVSTVWGNPTPETFHLMPKIPVLSINDAGGDVLKSLLDQGIHEAVIHAKVETKWTKIPTLTVEIKGNQERDQFALLSGHIDSWHYGAMDNGSANATMLEVVRVLSKYQTKLRRSLRLAFWSGHSHGRYAGSAAYCDKHWEDIHENCVMHFYVDSVGGKGATVLSESNCMAETKDIAAEFVGKITGQSYKGSRYGKSADQSFWGAGVPSLFMGMSEQPLSDDPRLKKVFALFGGEQSGGFGWWWHTTEDTIDKIDPNHLKRDCEIYALSIFKVLNEPILPLNQLAAVREIKHFIQSYHEAAGQLIDLSLTMDRVNQLETSLCNTQEHFVEGSLEEDPLIKLNRASLELSRYLVPINYVEGNRFDHDLALGNQPIPSLAKIGLLSKTKKDTHEYYLLHTALTRNINQVNYQLKQAIRVSEKINKLLKQKSII